MRRLLAVLLALAVTPAAAAATFNYSVTTASPVTAPGVTLTGDDQTKTFTIVSQVAYTGGGNTAGWNIQATSTTLTSGSFTLPALSVTAGSSTCASSCTTNPTSSVTYPVTLSALSQRIYNAAANTGRGTFNVTNTFQVTYPANAIASATPYSCTVTLTGATGP